jgi:hypothetical protein
MSHERPLFLPGAVSPFNSSFTAGAFLFGLIVARQSEPAPLDV